MIIDQIEEIYVSMSRNKLRIALTGFSIAWGIFMLIVLLGAGNGLLHGMEDAFASRSINTVSLSPGWTSSSFEGLRRYRERPNLELRCLELSYLGSSNLA